MIKGLQGRIKVDKKIIPLPQKVRKVPELKVDGSYYVSFGTNNAYPCKLIEIINEYERTEVVIEILGKSKKLNVDRNGTKSHYYTQEYILYANEIGITPEEAVKNEVHL